jgi:hypothetical protein
MTLADFLHDTGWFLDHGTGRFSLLVGIMSMLTPVPELYNSQIIDPVSASLLRNVVSPIVDAFLISVADSDYSVLLACSSVLTYKSVYVVVLRRTRRTERTACLAMN